MSARSKRPNSTTESDDNETNWLDYVASAGI